MGERKAEESGKVEENECDRSLGPRRPGWLKRRAVEGQRREGWRVRSARGVLSGTLHLTHQM